MNTDIIITRDTIRKKKNEMVWSIVPQMMVIAIITEFCFKQN